TTRSGRPLSGRWRTGSARTCACSTVDRRAGRPFYRRPGRVRYTVMDQARAFLQAIREAPDDDTPRLIFADWLDDHGGAAERARAGFIRAQIALARLDPDDHPARLALEDEADDLLAAHGPAWVGDVGRHAAAWRWRRGFVERVTVRADALLTR